MALEHFNAPRIAVVLLQNGKLRLSKHVGEKFWRFPGDIPGSSHHDVNVFEESERIILKQFKAHIVCDRLLNMVFGRVTDNTVTTTVYVLARLQDEPTNHLPGLQLKMFPPYELKTLKEREELAMDVMKIYEQTQELLRKG